MLQDPSLPERAELSEQLQNLCVIKDRAAPVAPVAHHGTHPLVDQHLRARAQREQGRWPRFVCDQAVFGGWKAALPTQDWVTTRDADEYNRLRPMTFLAEPRARRYPPTPKGRMAPGTAPSPWQRR